MRIAINLASDPFRRDRSALAAGWILGAALLLLLGLQSYLILAERDRAKETRESVARLSSDLAKNQGEQNTLEATLREPENAEVLARSVFLNTLVSRKSISWTRIFADLEGVMPYTVRLVQVRLPQINSRNEVTLDMTVAAEQPTQIIDFLRRLQGSAKFGPVTLHSTLPPSQNEPQYRSRVTVNYAQN
jgi:type IV pilus assembly protein PilN